MTVEEAYQEMQHRHASLTHLRGLQPGEAATCRLFELFDLASSRRCRPGPGSVEGRKGKSVQEYRNRVDSLIAILDGLPPPERLREVKRLLVEAIREQRTYFETWNQALAVAAAGRDDSEAQRSRGMYLKSSSQKLHQVYGQLMSLFPKAGQQNFDAFYDTSACWTCCRRSIRRAPTNQHQVRSHPGALHILAGALAAQHQRRLQPAAAPPAQSASRSSPTTITSPASGEVGRASSKNDARRLATTSAPRGRVLEAATKGPASRTMPSPRCPDAVLVQGEERRSAVDPVICRFRRSQVKSRPRSPTTTQSGRDSSSTTSSKSSRAAVGRRNAAAGGRTRGCAAAPGRTERGLPILHAESPRRRTDAMADRGRRDVLVVRRKGIRAIADGRASRARRGSAGHCEERPVDVEQDARTPGIQVMARRAPLDGGHGGYSSSSGAGTGSVGCAEG